MSSNSDNSISSGSLRFLQFFLWLLRKSSQTLKRRRRDWSLHFYYLCAIPFTLSVKVCVIELQTTYQNFMKIQRLTKPGSYSFTETVLGFCGKKESYGVKGISLSSDMFLHFPMGRMLGIGLWTWCSNFTMIQWWISPRSYFFLRQVWWVTGKRKDFGKRREKNENEGNRRHHQSENWPNTSLLIPRVLTTYYLLYLSIFIIL